MSKNISYKVNNFNQFVNENSSETFYFGIGSGHKSNQNDVLNYRKIKEKLMNNLPVNIIYKDGDSPMARHICQATINSLSKNVVEYECVPKIANKNKLHTIRDTDTIDGAIQIIQRYAESIYEERI